MKISKKIMAVMLLSLAVFSACTTELTETERFVEARAEQTCFAGDFEGDANFNDLSEEKLLEFQTESFKIYQSHGFDVNSEDELMELFVRMEAQVSSEEDAQRHGDRFLELVEKCLSPENYDALVSPPQLPERSSAEELEEQFGDLIESIEAQGGSVEVVPQ